MSQPMSKADSLTLHVTAKDIREGERMDPKRCPLSRAARRAIKRTMPELEGDLDVTVLVGIEANTQIGSVIYDIGFWHTSNAVKDWIREFDGGFDVKPRTFIVSM